MKLREFGEARLLEKLLPAQQAEAGVIAGVGDDCAVVEAPRGAKVVLLKTDCVVEGVHFTKAARPAEVGWKAMARPLSDFAAMSGLPRFALITIILSPDVSVRWITAVYRGLRKAAAKFDVAIVGGETSSISGPSTIVVAVAGEVEKRRQVLRSGGKAGDELFVTGRLGGSLRGRHLRFQPRIAESRWLTERFRIHAMMDLSDGLGADLPRLAAASGVGYECDANLIPRNRGCTTEQAMNDGEDYELLFAINPRDADKLQRAWRTRWKLKLTRIGVLNGKRTKAKARGGYDHFQQR